MLTTLKHSQLKPSKLNPRTTFDETQLLELAESIKAKGILQNLVVRKKGRKYEIAAGERRYKAVSLLIKNGDLTKDYALPVKIEKLSDLELVELATTENMSRSNMHPMDEANAFGKMLELGSDEVTLSLKMGMGLTTVKQRLALANKLTPQAKDALKLDTITLAQAQALTSASSETQTLILDELAEGYGWSPSRIKRFLTQDLMLLEYALFPMESYTGEISNNLFDDTFQASFLDTKQAKRLQLKALEEKATTLKETWSWVETTSYEDLKQWRYLKNEEADPKTQGVLIVFYEDTGKVDSYEGISKKEDSKATKSSSHKDNSSSTDIAPTSAHAESEPKPPKANYPKRLLVEARKRKTQALQTELLKDYRSCLILNIMGLLGADDIKLTIDPPTLGEEYQTQALQAIFTPHADNLSQYFDSYKLSTYPLKTSVYGLNSTAT